MANRIAVMNAAVIQQFGTPDEVYERPANLFVAGFIGAPAMNVLPGTISVANGGISAILRGVNGRLDLGHYPFTPRRPAAATSATSASGPNTSCPRARTGTPPRDLQPAVRAIHRADPRPQRHRVLQDRRCPLGR